MQRLLKVLQYTHSYLLKHNLLSRDEDVGVDPHIKLVVLLVFLTMMLDNMLLTVVVPIIPPILYKYEHGNLDYYQQRKTTNTTILPISLPAVKYASSYDRKSVRFLTMSNSRSAQRFNDGKSLVNKNKQGILKFKPPSNHADYEYEEYYIDYLETILVKPVTPHTQTNILVTTISKKLNTIRTWIDISTTVENPLPEDIINENTRVGMLFASKALVQLFINPLIAPLINKVGYGIPMCAGYVILFLSSIIFAFGKSYGVLLMARAIHGISSACLNISGLALIAEKFPNDIQRSVYMGRAMSGMAFGVFVGYPFGSVIYHFIGDSAPFWIISLITILIGGVTIYIIKPIVSPQVMTMKTDYIELFKDNFILIATGAIFCSTTSIAVLEPSLPIWLMNKIHPAPWKLGTVFLPDSFGYLIGTNFFAKFSYNVGRWKCAIFSMITIAICLILIPFANHPAHLVLPHFGIGLGIG
ncbi:unnamed protein product [Gordionus sp. m RMFG-2023]